MMKTEIDEAFDNMSHDEWDANDYSWFDAYPRGVRWNHLVWPAPPL